MQILKFFIKLFMSNRKLILHRSLPMRRHMSNIEEIQNYYETDEGNENGYTSL